MKSLIIVIESYIAGGADKALLELIQFFNDYDIIILANSDLDAGIINERSIPCYARIEYYAWTTPAQLANWSGRSRSQHTALFKKIFSKIVWPFINLNLYFKFRRRFKKSNPQLILINNGGYPGGDACRMASIATLSICGSKVIHVIHSMARCPRNISIPIELFIDYFVGISAKIVAVSNAVEASLKQNRRLQNQAIVIRNGIKPIGAYFPLQRGMVFKIIQVGYLCDLKNQILTIKALGALKKLGISNIVVTFAGLEADLGYHAKMIAIAEELNVFDQIKFVGFQKEIVNYYYQNDILLLTSKVEGLPICILEAMSIGRPVISTNVGGVREIIDDHKTGFLIESNDLNALVVLLRRILNDEFDLLLMGQYSYEKFLHSFSIEQSVIKYRELII